MSAHIISGAAILACVETEQRDSLCSSHGIGTDKDLYAIYRPGLRGIRYEVVTNKGKTVVCSTDDPALAAETYNTLP